MIADQARRAGRLTGDDGAVDEAGMAQRCRYVLVGQAAGVVPQLDQRPQRRKDGERDRPEIALGGEAAGPQRHRAPGGEILGALGEFPQAWKHLVLPAMVADKREHDAAGPLIGEGVERSAERRALQEPRIDGDAHAVALRLHMDEAALAHRHTRQIEGDRAAAQAPRQLPGIIGPRPAFAVDEKSWRHCPCRLSSDLRAAPGSPRSGAGRT